MQGFLRYKANVFDSILIESFLAPAHMAYGNGLEPIKIRKINFVLPAECFKKRPDFAFGMSIETLHSTICSQKKNNTHAWPRKADNESLHKQPLSYTFRILFPIVIYENQPNHSGYPDFTMRCGSRTNNLLLSIP